MGGLSVVLKLGLLQSKSGMSFTTLRGAFSYYLI